MVPCDFHEKIFEILVDHEFLSRGFDIYVPSQRREALVGFDALFQNGRIRIGILQYKVVNMYDRVPTCHRGAAHAFKFNLLRSGVYNYRQHNLLVRKANRGLPCGYFVPCFVSYNDLYQHYHGHTLIGFANTILIIPNYRIFDNRYHYISFDTNGIAYQHSKEKKQMETTSFKEFLNRIKNSDFTFDAEEFINTILDDEEVDDAVLNNEEKQLDKTKVSAKEEVVKILAENGLCLISYREN